MSERTVGDAMTLGALTVRANAGLREAAKVMEGNGIHRLIITGHDGVTPEGVLSTSDVIRDMTGAKR